MRTYALFLEERLECFRILKYDVEAERLIRPSQGSEKVCTRMTEWNLNGLFHFLEQSKPLLFGDNC